MQISDLMYLVTCFISIGQSNGYQPIGTLKERDNLIWRLPKTTRPLSYDLFLKVHPEDLTFEGKVNISIWVAQETEKIWLHSFNLGVECLGLIKLGMNQSEIYLNIKSILKESSDQNIVLEFHHTDQSKYTLERKETYIIMLRFEGFIQPEGYGFVELISGTRGNRTNLGFSVQNNCCSARTVFPCYDEPEYKARIRLTVNHNGNYSVISNMPVLEAHNQSGSDIWTVFERTGMMSVNFLTMILVKNFNRTSYPLNPAIMSMHYVPLNLYAPMNYSFERIFNIANSSFAAIIHMEEYFNRTHPAEKMDSFIYEALYPEIVPRHGLNMFKESNLLSFDKGNDEDLIKELFDIAAREYFMVLVTPRWWDLEWLGVSLSSFIGNKVYLEAGEKTDMKIFNYAHYCRKNYLFETWDALSREPTTYDDLELFKESSFSVLGECLLRMTEFFLGESVFHKGVVLYVEHNNNSIGDEDKFFAALQEAALQEQAKGSEPDWLYFLNDILKSWTHNDGLPSISIHVNHVTKSIEIEQFDAFLKPAKKWWIPLRITSSLKGTTTIFFMPPVERWNVSFTALNFEVTPESCFYMDSRDNFLYQVFYDQRNVDCLAAFLKVNHSRMDHWNRAALLRGFFLQDFSEKPEVFLSYLKLLEYLKVEESPYVWSVVLSMFTHPKARINFQNTDINEIFKNFYFSLMEPIMYNNISADDDDDNEELFKHFIKSSFLKWIDLESISTEKRRQIPYVDELKHALGSKQNSVLKVMCDNLKNAPYKDIMFNMKLIQKAVQPSLEQLLKFAECVGNGRVLMELQTDLNKTHEAMKNVCGDKSFVSFAASCPERPKAYYKYLLEWMQSQMN